MSCFKMSRLSSLLSITALGVLLGAAPVFAEQLKASKPAVSRISQGGCCAKVHGVCVTTCTKDGGCSGKGDCIVLKSK
jgi:hypothetical protein